MATATTTNLGLTTVDAGDVLPESISKTNFQTIDQYVAARSMTNRSGGTLPANSVVIADTTGDTSFTTTTTAGHPKVVGVTQSSIANTVAGIVKQYGITSVLVTGTTVRGDWLTTSTTAGQALPITSTNPPPGAFAIALSAVAGAGTVTAVLLTAIANNPYVKGTDVASATALQIGAAGTGQYFHVTGTTTITSISARTAGEIIVLEFDGALTFTHNATNLILTGAANVTTAAGHCIVLVSEGSGNWREIARSNILNTADGNLQAQGTAAAGTTRLAADAGHVHPATGWYKFQTGNGTSTGVNLTLTGNVRRARVTIQVGGSASLVAAATTVTANFGGAGHYGATTGTKDGVTALTDNNNTANYSLGVTGGATTVLHMIIEMYSNMNINGAQLVSWTSSFTGKRTAYFGGGMHGAQTTIAQCNLNWTTNVPYEYVIWYNNEP